MKLVIASNNAHKVREIKQILSPWFDDVVSLKDMGVSVEVVEDGKTFEENAAKKAREVHALLPDCAALADDSGLMVDALGGAPGVYSARYSGVGPMGEGATDEKNNQKLLEEMKNVPDEKRACRFVSCIALVRPGKEMLLARGTCEGVVGHEEKGDGGFGYDPLFVIPELSKTYAEITAEEKNAISHRGAALREMHRLLEQEAAR